ncbi:hypothetical protein D9M68_830380 [compost metagenome]
MVSPFSIGFSMICWASKAYSRGWPRRDGNGIELFRAAFASSGKALKIGVSNSPGAMVQTRMPLRARSRAMGSVIATTPPLDAA